MEPVIRPAVRAILMTPDERVLLMRFQFRWRTKIVWLTPGGGLNPGESAEQALVRELREETGLEISHDAISSELWHRRHCVELGGRAVDQRERYFLVPVETFTPAPTALDAGEEADSFAGFEWWPIGEIPEKSNLFSPRGLGRHLRELLASGAPDEPRPIEI